MPRTCPTPHWPTMQTTLQSMIRPAECQLCFLPNVFVCRTITTHGTSSALLPKCSANGSLTLLAKFVMSFNELSNVRYCKFSVVRSSKGEETPQYRCSRTMVAAPIFSARSPVVRLVSR